MLRHGVRVPEDMAIVGFDDIESASAAAIPLTSVRLPRRAMDRIATELLLEPELVVRESTLNCRSWPGTTFETRVTIR